MKSSTTYEKYIFHKKSKYFVEIYFSAQDIFYVKYFTLIKKKKTEYALFW